MIEQHKTATLMAKLQVKIYPSPKQDLSRHGAFLHKRFKADFTQKHRMKDLIYNTFHVFKVQ